MATVEDVLLPDIGDFSDVEVIEILVAPGDRVEAEESLLTLESDKASMEIPSPITGVVKTLEVAVGDRIGQGSLLATIDTGGDDTRAAASGDPAPDADSPPPPAPAPSPPSSTPVATESPQAAVADTKSLEVRLPDIGDFSDIPVIEILVTPGDIVDLDQSILTLESDKATMEIPCPAAGTVESIAVKVGDKLNQDDLLMTLLSTADAEPSPDAKSDAKSDTSTADQQDRAAQRDAAQDPSTPKPEGLTRAPGESEQRKAPVLPRPADMAAIAQGRLPHASPAVRRFARELGVDLNQVKGSGRKGRILKDDVQAHVKRMLSSGATAAPAGAALPFQLPPAPPQDFTKFGQVETLALSRIKRISGAHLHRSWLSVPHVTQFDEADITELEAFRKEQKAAAEQAGVKLTFMPFLLKAVAGALEKMPNLRSSLAADGEHLIVKHYMHIGVAVDTPNGLVVPVLRDVDKKGIFDLAGELMSLSTKARDGKLLPGDMQGGVFSVSSLGGIGGTAFTPIVNAPEVAILGVSRSDVKPVWNGDNFIPRTMLPLSLSYDHRVVDGAEAARFTHLLATLLGDMRRLLL